MSQQIYNMKFEIIENENFAALKVSLKKGEAVKAESGAMLSMDSHINVEGKMEGGLLSGLGRMLAGETIFIQTISAIDKAGEVILAPTNIGSIIEIEIDKNTVWNVSKGGFFAADEGIEVSNKLQNLARGIFSGEGFFVLKISGTGKFFISSFGAVIKKEIKKGEDYIVDNFHLVAWNSDAQIDIQKASSSWLNSFKSGEGLVTKITGPATVYIQTRNPKSFGGWLSGVLPSKK